MTRSAPTCAKTIMALVLLTGCTTSTPKPKASIDPEPTPQPITQTTPTTPASDIRTIANIKWPDTIGVNLLGVDVTRKLAYLQLKKRSAPFEMVIDAYNLKTGKRVMRWSADKKQAPKLVQGYPRFVAFNQNFNRDLQRYAEILRRIGPWSHREATAPLGVSVSPDGQHILYTTPPKGGRDGDWLMLAQGSRTRRFARQVPASYRVNFSPDSANVAWMGGQAKYARRGKLLGYVLHTADMKGTIKTYPQIRDMLRTPQWTQKSDGLFALGKVTQSTGIKQCIFYVDVQTQKTKSLYCYDGDMDFIYNPEDGQLLVLQHPGPQHTTTAKKRKLVLLDGLRFKQLAQYEVDTPLGFGAFGHFLSGKSVALFTHGGQKITIIETQSGRVIHTIDLDGNLGGRHTSQVVDGEMILLRYQNNRVSLIGARVRDASERQK